ncbi:CPBP family intramembrane glutamic endopeptidase [Actinopolyspora halophila]|uniref:CPBP family intramembrane glutamic endopeptidase n=1 Tax=Actinopolyspora halophila TaxID=1850 RepID=UPI00036D049B|nr:CPBP family intramembrane glutamic endopeptidase [Actinopolyspora halophila]
MGFRNLAGWILASVDVLLTGIIVFWLVPDPAGFVTNEMGINAQTSQNPWAWALALVGAVLYSAYTVRSVPFVNDHKFEFSPLKLLGIWAAVASGIVEEIVFRKKLMDLAAGWELHPGWQVLISAAVFGTAHAAWILMSGEVKIAVPVVVSTTVLGGLLAVVYVVAGRNVLPAIVAHTLVNIAIEPWLVLAAVSGMFPGTGRTR